MYKIKEESKLKKGIEGNLEKLEEVKKDVYEVETLFYEHIGLPLRRIRLEGNTEEEDLKVYGEVFIEDYLRDETDLTLENFKGKAMILLEGELAEKGKKSLLKQKETFKEVIEYEKDVGLFRNLINFGTDNYVFNAEGMESEVEEVNVKDVELKIKEHIDKVRSELEEKHKEVVELIEGNLSEDILVKLEYRKFNLEFNLRKLEICKVNVRGIEIEVPKLYLNMYNGNIV